jgi:phage repressor protein C with HTH and peptisase S24 domain
LNKVIFKINKKHLNSYIFHRNRQVAAKGERFGVGLGDSTLGKLHLGDYVMVNLNVGHFESGYLGVVSKPKMRI